MLKFLANKLPNTGMNFAVWDWSKPELYGIVLGMLAKLDLSGTLGIRKSEMLDFIIDVEKGYCATSYHSFYHAVDVVAVLYYMLTDLGVQKYLTNLDCVALLIAGLCHDIGHPGLNNVYQVNAKTELANRYNDQSVLENYSCDLTNELITKHNLFGNVHLCPTENYGFDPEHTDASLRQLIKKTILATDMAFHFGLLVEMDSMFEQACSSEDSEEEFDNSCPASSDGSASSSPISPSPLSSTSSIDSFFTSLPYTNLITLDANQRELLCKVLLHAADLSNTVRPWDISKRWSDLVVEEFFNQGDLEKKNNLPVSPNMDREQAHQCQISLRFGDFVVKPYFEAFAAFLNPAKVFLDTLKSNRLVIIPDDFQETLSMQRSPKHRRIKRSLSGRSYSHHSLLPPCSIEGLYGINGDSDSDDGINDHYRWPTRRKSAGLGISKKHSSINDNYTNNDDERSSSLDHNMIKQISALYGNGSNTEQRVVLAGS
ncbi:6730_t:CDS:2 [Paraglomus brasilianum]|uniref:Phosphodiesterase n=1 Tax=Paraglomus brasilianum TaxID=144538 RepID=A0A9N8VQF1_9GLOM|nr:6730_t:CDS:2 [Paraglomus brasilianum]